MKTATALLALAGLALIIYGLAMIYTPVATIVAGVGLLWVARVASEEL